MGVITTPRYLFLKRGNDVPNNIRIRILVNRDTGGCVRYKDVTHTSFHAAGFNTMLYL